MGEGSVIELLGPSAGGIRRHVGFLTAELERQGWDVTVAGPAGVMGTDGRQDISLDVPSLTSLHRLVGARRRLATVAAGADLIHAHGLKAGWLAASLPGGPPVVVTVHNLVLDEVAGWQAPILRALEERLPGRVAATIGVSQEIADRFAPQPVQVVPAAAPVAEPQRGSAAVRHGHGLDAGVPLVVTVARLSAQKGLDVLIRAAGAVRRLHPDVVFLIGGQGPLEGALRTQVEAEGLAGTVRLVGQLARPADEMAAADVVALASRWEGSPITHLEALQCGAALVATAVGDVPDFVVDGETGWLVPVDDSDALAGAIADALSRPEERHRRAEAGQQRAQALADPVERVARVAAVYRTAMEGAA